MYDHAAYDDDRDSRHFTAASDRRRTTDSCSRDGHPLSYRVRLELHVVRTKVQR